MLTVLVVVAGALVIMLISAVLNRRRDSGPIVRGHREPTTEV